jgi:hypothetical protein
MSGLIIARYLRRDRYLKRHPSVTSGTAPAGGTEISFLPGFAALISRSSSPHRRAEGAQRTIRAWRGKRYRAIVIIMQRGNGQVGRDADSPLEESGFELSVPLQGYSDQVICDWSWRSLLFGFGLQRCNRNLSLAWTASLGLVEA